jgi:LexA-binding, inner membrane-associated putative hydrolase
MFAVDHAATALLIRRRYRSAPLVPLLVSVQAMELAWVALNYAGVERTVVDAPMHSVTDVHLAYMPFSHSVATAGAAAAVAWVIGARWLRARDAAPALAIGALSHLVLDLLTHARDVALAPGSGIRLGVGLYDRAPIAAFVVELAFGIVCWWVYIRGRTARTAWRGLLAFVVVGNLLNLSFLAPGIHGPEVLLAGHPLLLVTVVCAAGGR